MMLVSYDHANGAGLGFDGTDGVVVLSDRLDAVETLEALIARNDDRRRIECGIQGPPAQLWIGGGDVFEVSTEGVGTLTNTAAPEEALLAVAA